MSVADYIIKSSEDGKEIENLVKYAKEVHGPDVVRDTIMNAGEDKKSIDSAIVNLVRTPKETLESKYAQPVYNATEAVLNKAQYLAKPYSVVASPILEAIGAGAGKDEYLGQGTIEGIKAGARQVGKEFSQWEPTPESSVGYQLQKHGIGQDSIINKLPSSIEEQFPKASEKIKNATYGDVAGLGADIALAHNAPSVPVGNVFSKITSKLDDMASLNRETALTRLSNVTGDLANESANKAKTQIIGDTISKYGLTPLLKNEPALKEAIGGKYAPVVNELGETVSKKVTPGLIDELHDHAVAGGEFISNKLSPINAQELADSVYNKMSMKFADPSSGANWSAEIGQDLEKKIDNIIKAKEYPDRSFGDLIKLKKSVADMYYDRMNKPELYSAEGAMPKAVYKQIWDEIDNKISSLAQTDPETKAFVQTNTDLSRMMDANNMLSGAKREAMQRLSLPEVAVGTLAGYGVGSMVGQGPTGAIIGGMYRGAAPLARTMEEKIPSYVAGTQEYLANKIRPTTSLPIPTVTGDINILTPDKAKTIKDYKLPRSYDEMKAELPLVKQKLGHEMGMQNAELAISHMLASPQEFNDKFPLLEQQMPQIFKYDRYRRVNGIIFDPMLKQLAEKEILNTPSSNTEKMMKQYQLLNSGKYDGI